MTDSEIATGPQTAVKVCVCRKRHLSEVDHEVENHSKETVQFTKGDCDKLLSVRGDFDGQ